LHLDATPENAAKVSHLLRCVHVPVLLAELPQHDFDGAPHFFVIVKGEGTQ
jgi:hypothetical protein